jgi:hydroxymethylbilane synthase
MTRPQGARASAIRLGSRGSPLALRQAGQVADRLRAAAPGLQVEIETIRTAAEKFPDRAPEMIGVGIFTREIDEELLAARIDLAVHSLKDLSSEIDPRLAIAAVPERESPLDGFVPGLAGGPPLWDLPAGAAIGTGSPRRKAQLLHRRPDLRIVPLRGNVETRIRKVREEGLAGTILAHAGLRRLGKEELMLHLIPPGWLVPAVGQGALAVVARADDGEMLRFLSILDHPQSRLCVTCERAFLRTPRGGCQVPAGALAELREPPGGGEPELRLEGVVASPDGASCLRGELSGPPSEAETLGRRLAEGLLERGGAELLRSLRGDPPRLGNFQS